MKRSPCSSIVAVCLASLFWGTAYADQPVPEPDLAYNYVITYYDRNHDGVVDFELHHLPGGADADWALSDTKFRGRYDLRIAWSFTLVREKVDMPVPKDVKITPGGPPVSETQ
jgi:hypothetical protein